MKVLCIDASCGWITKEMPPFTEGEIIEVQPIEGTKYHNYEDLTYHSGIWCQSRFIPVSEIDETEFEHILIKEKISE